MNVFLQDDEAAYGEEGNDNSEMYYEDEEYGSEADILVDPSSMITAGTSASVSGEGTNGRETLHVFVLIVRLFKCPPPLP